MTGDLTHHLLRTNTNNVSRC